MLILREHQADHARDQKVSRKTSVIATRYRVIEGRFVPGEWCIEISNEDGVYEAVTFFRGSNARERAIDHARDRFSKTLKPDTDAEPAATLTATMGDLRRGKVPAPRRATHRRGSRPSGSARNI
jgi:hypothetical protein